MEHPVYKNLVWENNGDTVVRAWIDKDGKPYKYEIHSPTLMGCYDPASKEHQHRSEK